MDLLIKISQELNFEFTLYLVPDGKYGARDYNETEPVPTPADISEDSETIIIPRRRTKRDWLPDAMEELDVEDEDSDISVEALDDIRPWLVEPPAALLDNVLPTQTPSTTTPKQFIHTPRVRLWSINSLDNRNRWSWAESAR